MGSLSKIVAVALMGAWSFGCGKSAPPDDPKVEPIVEKAPVPKGHLDRAHLEVVLRQGPPWLLERVPIEDVQKNGKFIGWRVMDLPLDWRDLEIQPGDVVTSVNAMPLETPNDFWAAWTSLSVASELKIAYLRHGEPQELSIPIFGQPSPELANDMQKRPGANDKKEESPVKANQEYREPKRKKTIIIKSNDKPLNETTTDYSNEY